MDIEDPKTKRRSMSRKSEELTNYEKYLNNLKHRGYENLPIPDQEESIDKLVAEGNRLLEEESQKKPTTQSKVSSINPPSDNPYLRARKKILSEMTEEKRSLIIRHEKEGKTDSSQYKDFVALIRKLGDNMTN
jgi:hypothetical protein